jgi:hypothetical protein
MSVKIAGILFLGDRVPVAACRWVINGPLVREPWLTGTLLADRTTERASSQHLADACAETPPTDGVLLLHPQ